MDQYEQIVEVYQAQNALQIARSQGAAQYAPEVMAKAEQEFQRAQQLQKSKAGTSQVVTAAREASQTAEDARSLAATRKKDAELAQAREQLAHEKQLRAEAEAAVKQSQAQPRDDRDTVLNGPPAAPPPPPPPPAPVAQRPEPRTNSPSDENARKMDRRMNLFRQLRTANETLDTSRGLVVMVHDGDFRGSELNPSVAANLAKIGAGDYLGTRATGRGGRTYGCAGQPGRCGGRERAQSVRDALVRGGVRPSLISVVSMGNGRPVASNASATGREQNRRVEIVISGDLHWHDGGLG